MDLIKYYSNKKVQEFLLNISKNREVAVKFQDNFGKRPDTLQFENDVLEFVKKGATSFHISEEHWSNPLLLKSGMTKSQLDSLKTEDLFPEGPKVIASYLKEMIKDELTAQITEKIPEGELKDYKKENK